MNKNRRLKEEIKQKVFKDNILLAKLANINRTYSTAVVNMIKNDAQKLMHIDFLMEIEKTLNISIYELTESF